MIRRSKVIRLARQTNRSNTGSEILTLLKPHRVTKSSVNPKVSARRLFAYAMRESIDPSANKVESSIMRPLSQAITSI